MKKVEPIFLAEQLFAIDELLITFLRGLSPNEWNHSTIAGKWIVKDIAAHLLDGNLRSLSMLRDHYYGDTPGEIDSYKDLLSYLNRLNADWVKAMKRLSPNLLVELLAVSGKAYCEHISSLDPFAKATFSVAWAGESESQNWFHIAREYTEKWHHQQQMRLAVGQETILLKNQWYSPYLDTSNRALPHHYRDVIGQDGDGIQLSYIGETEKNWSLKWEKDQWHLYYGKLEEPTCQVQIPDEVAWRVFTKGISKEDAIKSSKLTGNQMFGEKIFDLIAVMA
jgi:hypothetical protein